MDSVDIKVGDYLNQSEGKILIYRNVLGEELNQELLYNLTLDEDERILMVNTIEIENINIMPQENDVRKYQIFTKYIQLALQNKEILY